MAPHDHPHRLFHFTDPVLCGSVIFAERSAPAYDAIKDRGPTRYWQSSVLVVRPRDLHIHYRVYGPAKCFYMACIPPPPTNFKLTIMPPAHGQLSALVALIANATKIVEAHHEKSSMPYVPSLDDLTQHPLDTEISSPELQLAIQTIEGACAQLCATVARPNHTMVNVSLDTDVVLG